MKTIKEGKKNIELLWHPPKVQQTMYRSMKFLLKAKVEDGLLLYNVVTSRMVLLDEAEERLFECLPSEYSPGLDELIAKHFVVAESFEENKSVQQLRALLRKLGPSKRVSGFSILPTTECNARCYYCFESDHPRCTMTDQIVEDTVAYIAKMSKDEPIEIGWFGGEPMVGKKQIDKICEGLRKRGIQYKSSMISNAYLFDETNVKTAKEDWHLRSVQITLDGTERVYNETKAYVNPRDNPYQRVLRNIDLLLDQGIAVNVRLNVTADNVEDLSALIEELAARFGGKKGFSAYSHPVYADVGYKPLSYEDDQRKWVVAQSLLLDDRLREKKLLGSYAKLPELKPIKCMADNDSCRIIYPEGIIGKCEDKSSLDGVGNIYDDITDHAKYAEHKAVEQYQLCADCPMFPECINLTVCRETGNCSCVKVEWKKDRYTELMKDRYQRCLQSASETCSEENVQTDCGS